jgi:hypothetical protein
MHCKTSTRVRYATQNVHTRTFCGTDVLRCYSAPEVIYSDFRGKLVEEHYLRYPQPWGTSGLQLTTSTTRSRAPFYYWHTSVRQSHGALALHLRTAQNVYMLFKFSQYGSLFILAGLWRKNVAILNHHGTHQCWVIRGKISPVCVCVCVRVPVYLYSQPLVLQKKY